MKNTIIKQALKGAVLVPALTLLAVGIAEAGDRKVYPASFGAKYSGPEPSYNASAIANPSSTLWMYVDLPVINDDVGSGIDTSYVRVLDRHYSSNVRCSINTVYWNNSAGSFYGYWGPNRYSAGSGNTEQILNTGAATHGSTRHEYFSCAVPPTYLGNRSYLISYTVEE